MGKGVWPDGMTHCDWYEVAGLLMEMEAENGVAIELIIMSGGSAKHPDLTLEARAVKMDAENMEAVRWASTKCRASITRTANLKALCTYLLYQLDFAIVEQGINPEDTK